MFLGPRAEDRTKPEILSFIAHEDEEKAMKELGLLQGIDLPGKLSQLTGGIVRNHSPGNSVNIFLVKSTRTFLYMLHNSAVFALIAFELKCGMEYRVLSSAVP